LYLKDKNDLSLVTNELDTNNEWVFLYGIPTRKFDGSASAIINGELYKRYDVKPRTAKKLKVLNYYIDIIEVGSIVSKISKHKFQDCSLTDEVISFGVHSITVQKSAILKNNGEMDLRQLKPIGEIPLKYFNEIPEGAIPCQEPDLITGHYPHWVKCDRNKPEDKYHFDAFDNQEGLIDGTYELCGEKIKSNPEKIVGHKLIKHGCEVLPINDFSFESLKNYLSDESVDIEGIVFHNKFDDRLCKIRKSDFGIKRQ
jgi:hypothetical protein